MRRSPLPVLNPDTCFDICGAHHQYSTINFRTVEADSKIPNADQARHKTFFESSNVGIRGVFSATRFKTRIKRLQITVDTCR